MLKTKASVAAGRGPKCRARFECDLEAAFCTAGRYGRRCYHRAAAMLARQWRRRWRRD